MSTWTSRRAAAGLLGAALALSACAPGVGVQGPVRSLAVAEGAVVVAGPPGYCVDRSQSRDRADGAFVLLGACSALGMPGVAPPEVPAVLTAAVDEGNFGNQPLSAVFPQMRAFLSTPSGRAALSRAGLAETVRIDATEVVGEMLLIRLGDRAPAPGVAVQETVWRAVFAVDGRIVSLSVIGLAERPVSARAHRALLLSFAEAVRAASR